MATSHKQVVLISGGSRGLGQALVEDQLRAGSIVATFSRSSSEFLEQCADHDPEQARFFYRSVDATRAAEVSEFVHSVSRRYGRIDVLVNNAATSCEGILTVLPDADIHQTLTLNLEAVIQLTKVSLKSMLAQGSGCVINISSVHALRGHQGVSIYSATKSALDGLTRSLAREMGPAGIRVNSVAPGFFESDMTANLTQQQRSRIVRRTPLSRLGSTDDIVHAVRFLASEQASFITGQILVVDGGLTS